MATTSSTDLQRRTMAQARAQALVPMKYDAGMDPNERLHSADAPRLMPTSQGLVW